MGYLVFFAYLLLCCWLLRRFAFFRNSGIPGRHLLLFFLLKVAAGVAFGLFYTTEPRGGDTWEYHRDGLRQLAMLYNEPLRFVRTLWQPGYDSGYGAFFGVERSWWNDLDWHLLTKMLACFDVLTGSNYYANNILFNLLTLPGVVLLYRLWHQHQPAAPAWMRYAPFLVPSYLFWTSGTHKEGILVLALGLVLWPANQLLENNHKTRYWLSVGAGLLLVLAFRNFLLLPLVAALAGWVAATRWRRYPGAAFALVLLLGIMVFFGLQQLAPALDFPGIIVERRAAFSQLTGTSRVDSFELAPTVTSFVANGPQALWTAAFRPLPGEAHRASAMVAAAENCFLLLLTVGALVAGCTIRSRRPYFLFCTVLCVLVLLVVGYTIPFMGATVRYRSTILPFWIMVALSSLFVYAFRWKSRTTSK